MAEADDRTLLDPLLDRIIAAIEETSPPPAERPIDQMLS
jgi:hypothetical protein